MDALDSDQTGELDRIARALDAMPGPEGDGLAIEARTQLFAYLDSSDYRRWKAARRIRVSRFLSLWVATMRHAHVGMYDEPTAEDVLSTLEAVGAGTIAR